uniref:Peptidylprolyl isomerase n=1 Tax=Pyrodinium bahamense TaxID=73915 RepID=A0A7S0FCH6_9DINO|mmetsp:Transcript_20711/g.57282  ORF Transcript_20711/g.57282 Transcript_20711/m.57282 type:complete len:545 (+) Transcript_20711:221-1855(+)
MVSQGVGGHEGYSGTPLWKIQQQTQQQREALLQESLLYVVERKPIVPPNVLVEAVNLGGSSGKPLARHVLVKCLRKVADRNKIELPSTGLFQNQAPMGLFALFDGQSCAGEPGPAAAEYCARNFHKKVMDNLASLPPGCTSETFVKAALVKSFEDLDRELLESQPEVKDGCGAVVALLLGEYLFTAVLGACDGVLCEAVDGGASGVRPVCLGRNQGRCHLPEERARLLRNGGTVIGEGAEARVCGPAGASAVSRSLGDPGWKQPGEGVPVLSCIPEIQSVKLSWAERHLCFLLATKPVAEAFEPQELLAVAMGFPAQPRAACGEIATKAVEKHASSQCTAVEVWLLAGGPSGEGGGAAEEDASAGGPNTGGSGSTGSTAGAGAGAEAPPKKKPKASPVGTPVVETKSARLRHILVKFQDGQKPAMDVSGRKVTRTRQEAEALLRRLLRELREELEELRRKPNQPKKPEELALRSERFSKLCKEHSECPTSQKGGGMCGDLGWVSKDAQQKLGKDIQGAVAVLRPGDWSDIVASNDGLHIIQRIA